MKTCSALRSRARTGFTLLELVVVVAVIAILAGSAVPVASKMMAAQARKATREELRVLSDATLEYFRDTHSAPKSIADLERDPKKSTSKGWAGPYVTGAVPDPLAKSSGHATDAWSRPYVVKSTTVTTITSTGEDGVAGNANDIVVTVDFTPIRRLETQEELRLLNQSILVYNGQYMASEPLPASWKSALAKIVSKGLLPDSKEYLKDAWDVDYVATPEGKSPLVKLASKSLSGGTGSGKKK